MSIKTSSSNLVSCLEQFGVLALVKAHYAQFNNTAAPMVLEMFMNDVRNDLKSLKDADKGAE